MYNKQLQKILGQLDDHEKRIRVLEGDIQSGKKNVVTGQADSDNSANLVLSIVNKVVDCEESEDIQRKVLDQKNMEAKILLCFYVSYKYFDNAWLTSGDIEKITSDLGIKIDQRNITNKLEKIRRYLESASARKKGRATPYRLNRKGVQHFEKILHGRQT